MPDTQTQSTGDSAQSGYGGPVTTTDQATENERAALAAIEKIHALDSQQESLRETRDRAAAAMHTQDGLRAPEIARRLGMSVTNVRLAIERYTR